MGACPSKPCPFKRGDRVKRLGNKPDYGKLGTVTDVKYTGDGNERICSQVKVEYDDGSTENESVSLFKLLSRESCPWKVGDKVKHKTLEYTGVVEELDFFNDLGEEQDKCQKVTVKRDDSGDEEDVDAGGLEMYTPPAKKEEEEIKPLPELEEELPETEPPIDKCDRYVKSWLKGRKEITAEDIRELRRRVPGGLLSTEELMKCIKDRNIKLKPTTYKLPQVNPPPASSLPPLNVCNVIVKPWLGDKKEVTLEHIRQFRAYTLNSTVSDNELEACLLIQDIKYPPRPWDLTEPTQEEINALPDTQELSQEEIAALPGSSKPQGGVYFESQSDVLSCGRHALNNMVGSLKYDITSTGDIDLNNPSFPMNLKSLCKKLEEEAKSRNFPNPYECRDDEYYNIELLNAAARLLGYEPQESASSVDKIDNLLKTKFGIGYRNYAIINLGANHWVSLRADALGIHYFDSLKPKYETYDTRFKLIDMLKPLNPVSIQLFKKIKDGPIDPFQDLFVIPPDQQQPPPAQSQDEEEKPPAPAPGGPLRARPPQKAEEETEEDIRLMLLGQHPRYGAFAATPQRPPITSEKIEELSNRFIESIGPQIPGVWEPEDKNKQIIKKVIESLGDERVKIARNIPANIREGTKYVELEVSSRDGSSKWISKPKLDDNIAIKTQRGGATRTYKFVIYISPVLPSGGIRVKTYRKRKAQKKATKLTRKKHNG